MPPQDLMSQGEVILPSEPKEVVLFDAKKENQMRHNKNLHGEGHYVDGLTGFYHRKYYRDGRHQPRKRP